MPIAFYPVPKDELEQLQEFFPASTAVGERDNLNVGEQGVADNFPQGEAHDLSLHHQHPPQKVIGLIVVRAGTTPGVLPRQHRRG